MGFFDDLPASEPEPRRRHHHPWEPPEAEFPGIVPIDTLLLARTDQVAVAVTGLSAFSAGIEIFLTARIRPSADHPGEHRPRWLGIAVRPAAAGAPDGLAAVRELQAEPEGAPGGGQFARPAGQVALGLLGTGPDPRGQEDLDPGGKGRQPGDRHGDLVRPRQQQGVDRHNPGEFRFRRLPWVMPSRRRRLGHRQVVEESHAGIVVSRRGGERWGSTPIGSRHMPTHCPVGPKGARAGCARVEQPAAPGAPPEAWRGLRWLVWVGCLAEP